MKVLVVDDNQALLEMLGMLLESYDHQVTLLDSPVQAALLARTEAFDLLVTDVCMPLYSGMDLASNVRMNRVNFDIAVLLISAHAQTPDALESMGANTQFLQKPFNSEVFLKVLHSLQGQESLF